MEKGELTSFVWVAYDEEKNLKVGGQNFGEDVGEYIYALKAAAAQLELKAHLMARQMMERQQSQGRLLLPNQ